MRPRAAREMRAHEGGLVGIEGTERSGGGQRGQAGAVIVVHVGSTTPRGDRISAGARLA